MKIIDFFARTYIINLPDRKDRRKKIMRELEKAGMPITSNKIEVFPAISPKEAKGFPSPATRGCFLSHLAILKQAKEKQLPNVLIMEDDLKISENFQNSEQEIVEHLHQTDWGFLYLGHLEKFEKTFTEKLQPFSQPIVTTHFYGVNSTIFNQLILFLEELQERPPGDPKGGPMHVDGAYSTFRQQNPDIQTLIACPSLGSQRSSASNINPNWFDRLPLLRELANVARTVKEE